MGLPIVALGFLTPWLFAAGAAATSIPIIIHLLNKRKFRVVVWAAMEWLLAAQRRNARRLRFQRWLLLAVRCLALLILAAGIAQLILQSQAFGKLLGEQRTTVILWDDSYSMGYQGNRAMGGDVRTATAFERARKLIGEYVGKLEPADKVLIVRTSRLAGEAGKPTLDHAAVQSQVTGAQITDASTDLPGAFEQAAAVMKEAEGATRVRRVLVVTDFSNSSIHDPVRGIGAANRLQGLEGDRLKKAADELRAHATDFRVFDVGDPSQTNLAVTDLRPRRPAVVANAPADFDVTVLNATEQARLDVPLTILLDGVPVQTEKLPKVDAGAPLTATFRLAVPGAGRHLLEVRLPADNLPTDDVRRLLLNVRRDVPVLLVDGSPGDGGRTSYGSTAYLWAAYAFPAEGKPASPFAPKVVTELELPTTPLNGYDVVALSDTGELPPAVRENLKHFVEGGGLLLYFPGNRTNATRTNDTLGEQGLRLLPATLGQLMKPDTTDAAAAGTVFAPEGWTHPVLSVFAPDTKAGKEIGFTTVQTTQYLKLGVPSTPAGSDEANEVILRYAMPNGAPGDPAVVMRTFGEGKGRVVLFASTADMTWNTWGAKPSFLPFMHELTYYGMSGERGTGLTMRLGDRLHMAADFAQPGSWMGPRESRLTVTSELDKQGRAYLSSGPLMQVGVYTPPGEPRAAVAVNPDTEEADVRHVTAGQMAAALGVDVKTIVEGPSTLVPNTVETAKDPGGLLGPGLVGAALALFFLETVLAMRFSSYR